MPKAGKYEYPYFDIDASINQLKTAHGVIRSDEMDKEVVETTLGLPVTGGSAFIVPSMAAYGLVKTYGNKVIVTELGKLAVYGDDKEQQKSKREAVLKVELFKELFAEYGKDANINQIKAVLRQKGDVPLERAQDLAENVDRIYKKVAKHIAAEEPEKPAPSTSQQQIQSANAAANKFDTQKAAAEKKSLLRIQLGDTYLEAEKNDVAAAKSAIQRIAKEFGLKVVIKSNSGKNQVTQIEAEIFPKMLTALE